MGERGIFGRRLLALINLPSGGLIAGEGKIAGSDCI